MAYPTPTTKGAASTVAVGVADGTYNVNLSNSSFNWANGALVVNLVSPQPFVKYKGNDVTSSFNNDISNVGWTVTLQNAGVNSTLVFTGGSSTSSSGPFAGGTVSGLPAQLKDAESGWGMDSGPDPKSKP